MSFQNAKRFIVDFYANPLIRIKIFKIQNKKISKIEQINQLLEFAKKKGYDFTLFDLIKAINFKQKIQKLSTSELINVFGGTCLNYSKLNKANTHLKSIENLIFDK